MSAPPKGRIPADELKKQFDFFDVDGDGFITKVILLFSQTQGGQK